MAYRAELYIRVPPPKDNIAIETSLFQIDYSIPMVENIEWEVCCLRCHYSGETSNMRAEHFQSWLAAATLKEHPDTANWERVVKIL